MIACSGRKCDRRNECAHFFQNIPSQRIRPDVSFVSQADQNGQCNTFKEVEKNRPDSECMEHLWVTRRRGGHPADPESHERITVCASCGEEKAP